MLRISLVAGLVLALGGFSIILAQDAKRNKRIDESDAPREDVRDRDARNRNLRNQEARHQDARNRDARARDARGRGLFAPQDEGEKRPPEQDRDQSRFRDHRRRGNEARPNQFRDDFAGSRKSLPNQIFPGEERIAPPDREPVRNRRQPDIGNPGVPPIPGQRPNFSAPDIRNSGFNDAIPSFFRKAAPNSQLAPKANNILKKIAEAKSGSDEREATEELRSMLNEQFEKRMVQREKQIEELEMRIKKLRSQLEVRRDAKKKIVDLKLQTLVNEAKGLGF